MINKGGHNIKKDISVAFSPRLDADLWAVVSVRGCEAGIVLHDEDGEFVRCKTVNIDLLSRATADQLYDTYKRDAYFQDQFRRGE